MRKKAEKVTQVELLDPNKLDDRLSSRIEGLTKLCKGLQPRDKQLEKGLKHIAEYRNKIVGKNTIADSKKEKLIKKIDKEFPEVLSSLNISIVRKNYEDYDSAKNDRSEENKSVIAGLYLTLMENIHKYLNDTTISTQNRAEVLGLLRDIEKKTGRANSTVEETPSRVKTSGGRFSAVAPIASPATSPMPMQGLESPRGENLSPRGEEGHSDAPKVLAEESPLKPRQKSQENSPQYLELEESAKHCHESQEKLDQFVFKAALYILDQPDATRANMEVNVLILKNEKIKGLAQLLEKISVAVKAQASLNTIALASDSYFSQCESHAKESDLREHSLFHAKNPFEKEKNELVTIADDYIIRSKDSVNAFHEVVEILTGMAGEHGKISKLRSSELLTEIEKDVNDAGYNVKHLPDDSKK